MASIGDLKGRVVITGNTGALGKVRADMEAIANASRRLNTGLGQYTGNLAKSANHNLQLLNRQTAQGAAMAAGSGLAFRGIIDQTKDFNESKFGYGFARLTDFMKDGRLQMEAWRDEMNRAARSAQSDARTFGTLPSVTMKAMEEVEKLGFKGNESRSIFEAALGLHLSEPTALASGAAAKYMGAVYRAYREEQEKLAAKLGKDADDPEFVRNYVKSMAAKAAIAGSESALGPADIVEGMRQYAPQWAAMGIPYSTALALLAHGANYGFRAPELGTAHKSFVNKATLPTAAALNTLNRLGVDRSKFFSAGPNDPDKATNALNSLLSGSLFSGKGGRDNKSTIRQMMDTAYKSGVMSTPDFQNAMTQEVMRMLGQGGKGKGWEGRVAEIQQAVSNATVRPNGNFNLFGYINELRSKGATVGEIATIFEGRHVARYTPMFKHYDELIKLAKKIEKVDSTAMDAVVEGRKQSEAGKTDQMQGAWQSLMIALEQSGGIIDFVKTKFTELFQLLSDMPTPALSAATAGALGLGAIGTAAVLAGGLPLAWKLAKSGGKIATSPGAGAAAYVGGGLAGMPALAIAGSALLSAHGIAYGAKVLSSVAGWALGRAGVIPRAGIVGAPVGLGATAANIVGRRVGLLGGMKAVALGAGRFLIPGLGIVSLAASAYGAYQGYQETGTVGGAVRGALGIPNANAAPATGIVPPAASRPSAEAQPAPTIEPQLPRVPSLEPPSIGLTRLGQQRPRVPSLEPPSIGLTRLGQQRPRLPQPPSLGPAAPASPPPTAAPPSVPSVPQVPNLDDQVQQMVARMRATLAAVDFTAEGQRIMQSLANGLRAGAPAVDAAIEETASRMRARLNAVRLNTGANIGASP